MAATNKNMKLDTKIVATAWADAVKDNGTMNDVIDSIFDNESFSQDNSDWWGTDAGKAAVAKHEKWAKSHLSQYPNETLESLTRKTLVCGKVLAKIKTLRTRLGKAKHSVPPLPNEVKNRYGTTGRGGSRVDIGEIASLFD